MSGACLACSPEPRSRFQRVAVRCSGCTIARPFTDNARNTYLTGGLSSGEAFVAKLDPAGAIVYFRSNRR